MKKNIGLAILLAISVKINYVSASSRDRIIEISGRNDELITGQEIKELNLTDSDTLIISRNNKNLENKEYGELYNIIWDTGSNKIIDVKSIIFSDNHMGIDPTLENSINSKSTFIKIPNSITILARNNISVVDNSNTINEINRIKSRLIWVTGSRIVLDAKNIEISRNHIYTTKNYDNSLLYFEYTGDYLNIGTPRTESVTISENIIETTAEEKNSGGSLLRFGCNTRIYAKNISFTKNTLINGESILYNSENTTLETSWYDTQGGYHLGGSVIISENVVRSEIIDNNGVFYVKANKIIINRNKVAPTNSTKYKYGVLINNRSGDLTFEFKGNNSIFELADNSLIDDSDDKGIIGILLGRSSSLNFINREFCGKCKIKLGYDILSCDDNILSYNRYIRSAITFRGNKIDVELGTHIIEAWNINLKTETNICVDMGKNGLVGNLRFLGGKQEDSLLFISYGVLTLEPSFAKDFEDDGESELAAYKVINGFKNIIGRERIKLKDEQKILEWHGGTYKPRLISENNDFSIVLERLTPPIKTPEDVADDSSNDSSSEEW